MAMSARMQQVLFVTIMVTAMSGVVSLTLGLMRVGFSNGIGRFVEGWLRDWALAFVIAWPTAYLVVPVARRIVTRLSRP